MAIKLSVGLQKKVGLPDYGSLGASCHVEFEIERSMLENDLNGFHQKVHSVFATCQQAVNEQLIRQHSQQTFQAANNCGNPPEVNGHANGNSQEGRIIRIEEEIAVTDANQPIGGQHSPALVNRVAKQTGNGNTNGGGGVRSSTSSQVRAIHAIANRNQVDLMSVLGSQFNVSRPEDLSIREASSLIDQLKAGTSGSNGNPAVSR